MDRQKVFFVHKISEGEFETESLWCIKSDDNYILDNIPFVVKRVSLGDIIKAVYDPEDKVYYFDDFVKVSGNSTIRIYLDDLKHCEKTREKLRNFGCESEFFLARKILAVNIPKEINYIPVKEYLDNGENSGLWSYEESCLAHEIL